MKIKIKKRHCEQIIPLVFSVLIVLLSGTVYVSLSETSIFRSILYILFYILAFYMLLAILVKRKINRSFLKPVSGAFILMLISSCIYPETKIDICKLFLIFTALCVYIEYSLLKRINIDKYFFYIILFLSATSILIFVAINILKINLPNDIISGTSISYDSYLGLYMIHGMYRVKFLGDIFYRVQSIFWEPGIFSIYINYAIFLYLFKNISTKIWTVICLYTCLVLTLSTTGLCLGIVLLAYKYYSNIKNISNRVVLIVPIMLIISIPIVYIVSKKANMDVNINGSYFLRVNDIRIGLKAWVKRPIFGWGYLNNEAFYLIAGYSRGSSNGLITWLDQMGLFGTFILVYPFIENIKKFRREYSIKSKKIILFLLYIVCSCTEPIVVTPFMMMIVGTQCFNSKNRKFE